MTTNFVDGVTVVTAEWLNSVDSGTLSTAQLAGELLSAGGASRVGSIAAGAGMVVRSVAEVLADTLSAKSGGAICDYLTDDTAAIQRVIDAAPAGSTVEVFSHKIKGPIYIGKALTIRAKNGNARFLQETWGAPCFVVDSVSDVFFSGNFSFEYTGLRDYPIPVPTNADARIQAFYTAHSGSERVLCSGIVVSGKSDNFNTCDISSRGFFCGISFTGSTSSTANDSKNVKVGIVNVDTVDWGVLIGGGVADICIAGVNAKNIKCTSPSDPSHAVYIGPRAVGIFYNSVDIGFIKVDGVELIANDLNSGDAFSIRSTKSANIGHVFVKNSRFIGNARDSASVTIGHLYADTLTSDATIASGILFAVSAQSNSSILIKSADVTIRNGVSAAIYNLMFQASSGGSLILNSGKYRMVGAACGQFVSFGGKDLHIGSEVTIEYDNPVAATLAPEVAYPISIYGTTGRLLIDCPTLIGDQRLACYTPAISSPAVDLSLIRIDPNKIVSGSIGSTVLDPTAKYRIEFTSFPITSSLLDVGAIDCILQGRNSVKTQNISPITMVAFKRGAQNQRYIIFAGDSQTTLQHGNVAGGLVCKGAANITAGSWKAVEAIWISDRLYELSRV